uniref:UBP-type domain-containing protein n=1 Tax=Oryza punctata TaxID=4537 RepID=A0A0E0JZY9_ORYPU
MQYQYQLFEAAHSGDLELFKRTVTLLDGGRGRLREVVQAAMAQDTESWDGMGALHIAASKGRLEVCHYLIEELRLDMDDADQGGATPLMAAIIYNHISIINYLLYHGAGVNKARPDGSSPLHYATHLVDCGMIKQLLAKGASVDPVAYCGTPLHIATTKGRDGAIKILLDHRADCSKDPLTKQQGAGSKERGGKEKKKKKKGGGARGAATNEQAKVEVSHVWACLVCGQHYCGGANAKPSGHAEAHCSRNKHWWVANPDDPITVYCFKCRNDFLLDLSIVHHHRRKKKLNISRRRPQ